MIKANCRERFTAGDFDFMVQTLARTGQETASLASLLTDAEVRDAILDHPRLFTQVLEAGGPLTISPQLYFYLLVRHVLKQAGLEDRALSDYVAALLEKFSHQAGLRSPASGAEGVTQYLTDMLAALHTATPQQAFLIRAHVGNYALFISGIFPERVTHRWQRGGPDLHFYEGLGRASYRAVSRHQLARSFSLTPVYEVLAEAFHEVRLALNRLADALLHLDGPRLPAPGLC